MKAQAEASAGMLAKWFGSKVVVKTKMDEILTNNFEIFVTGKSGTILVWSRMTKNHKILGEATQENLDILKQCIADIIAGKAEYALPASEAKGDAGDQKQLTYKEYREKAEREHAEEQAAKEAAKQERLDRLAAVAAEKKAAEDAEKKKKQIALAKKKKRDTEMASAAAKKKAEEDARLLEEKQKLEEEQRQLEEAAQKQLEEERIKQEEEEKAKQLAAEAEAAEAAARAAEEEARAAAAKYEPSAAEIVEKPEFDATLAKKSAAPVGFFAFLSCMNVEKDFANVDPNVDDAMLGA